MECKSVNYESVVLFVLGQGRIDAELLGKAFGIKEPHISILIDKLRSNGVISEVNEKGEYIASKIYNHSDYLLELERAYDKEIVARTPKDHTKYLTVVSAIIFVVSIFFLFREPISLAWVIPLSLMLATYSNKMQKGMASLGIIFLCVMSLLFVNSTSPIWGEQYKLKKELKERVRHAQNNLNEARAAEAVKILNAQKAVSALLKDPSSAKFTNERVGSNGVVCGFINAKNSFGAYTGPQRYAYIGRAYVDDASEKFSSLWDNQCP